MSDVVRHPIVELLHRYSDFHIDEEISYEVTLSEWLKNHNMNIQDMEIIVKKLK